jgi:pimeloyl-ACP methyl ester carboxylesterase
MSKFNVLFVVIGIVVSGCQSIPHKTAGSPSMKEILVNGVNIVYQEQGHGVPVVFVHGVFADHRVWENQREAVAAHYRFIAIDQRYYGIAPWTDNGWRHSQSTHAEDLAAFVRGLRAGPVHLVGISYGASIALIMTVEHPELVRTLSVQEPPIRSVVTDPAELKIVQEEEKSIAPALAAGKAWKSEEATRLFYEWVEAAPGSFDNLPPATKACYLENSRTVPLFFHSPPPPPVSCAQLAAIKVPVLITTGERSRPIFKVIEGAVHRCIPGSLEVVMSNVSHYAPAQNPTAYNAVLLGFLEKH